MSLHGSMGNLKCFYHFNKLTLTWIRALFSSEGRNITILMSIRIIKYHFFYCEQELSIFPQKALMIFDCISSHIGWAPPTTLHVSSITIVYGKKYMNATCKVLVPCFMSWNKRSQKCFICTKSLFLSTFVHTFLYILVSEHFSFAKIIHPPDRCGISIS